MTFFPSLRIPHISKWQTLPRAQHFPGSALGRLLLLSSCLSSWRRKPCISSLCQNFNALQGISIGDTSCLLNIHSPFLKLQFCLMRQYYTAKNTYLLKFPCTMGNLLTLFWRMVIGRGFRKNYYFSDKKETILPRDSYFALYSSFSCLEHRLEAWR